MVDRYRLITWLLENGYAEPERGYGHVSAEELAEALLEEFHIDQWPWR